MDLVPGFSIGFATTLGLVIGSFLNVVILRMIAGKSLSGRSACPSCGHILSPIELVPVFSFIFQKGRCRACKNRISIQYPLVELTTALTFGAIAYFHDPLVGIIPAVRFMLYAAGAAISIALAGIDYRTTIVPSLLVYPLAVIALISTFFASGEAAIPSYILLSAGIITALPLALLWLVSHGRWIGLGDAKYALSMGWFLGLTGGATALMLAFWIGAVVGVLLLWISRVRAQRAQSVVNRGSLFEGEHGLTMKSEIPFAPFLIAATAIVAVSGFDLLLALA